MDLPRVGALFAARYRLDKVLGEGGSGTVFLATDAADRRVAVKIVKPDRPAGYSDDVVRRFEREVRILASLRDPRTVTLFDHGRSDEGLLFTVSEFVPGQDLARLLAQRGRLDEESVRHIVEQVLYSLREAHAAGLLHRDIKPENICAFAFMGDPLCVKVLDFGIARAAVAPADLSITRTGELVGTPRYMAPEQLMDHELTPAADIYSLGVVAYELLMGSDAVHGAQWSDQFDRLLTGHVFSIPEIERISPRMRQVVQRMAARTLEERFQTADEVLEALRGSPPSVQPVDEPGSTTGLGIWVAGASALMVVIAVLGWAATRDAEQAVVVRTPPPPPPVFAQPPAVEPAALPVPDAGPPPRQAPGEPGCGIEPPFRGRDHLGRSPLVEGWLAYVPTSYDPRKRYPVMLLFHDEFQAPDELLGSTGFEALAEREGFVILAPEYAVGLSLEEKRPWRHPTSYIDDLEAALAKVSSSLCVDASRLFAVGHGFGGRAAETLPCIIPLAATASTSFRHDQGDRLCTPEQPVPHLAMTGMHDGYAPVEGGRGCSLVFAKLALAEQERLFRERNGCRGERREYVSDSGGVCYTWDCDGALVSCHLDGGHNWPGVAARANDVRGCDGTPADFPFAETIWRFLSESQR